MRFAILLTAGSTLGQALLSARFPHYTMFDEADQLLTHPHFLRGHIKRQRSLVSPAPRKITILHTNDIHAHLDQFNPFGGDCREDDILRNECFGGIARMKTVIDEARARSPNTLLFDAGDQFQGTLFYLFYKGEKISRMMNKILQYDLMTIGNHEFDDGEEYLAAFLQSLNFPVVLSNMDLDDTVHLKASNVVKPYHIFEEYALGVIGYITNTTAGLTLAAKDIRFYNPVDVVQKYIDELHRLGIRRIVCVSHNGYNDDKYLAENTRGISLIVGGHSHSLLHNALNDTRVMGPFPTQVTNLDGKSTYVVQAYRFGQYMGMVDLEFDEEDELVSIEGEPILLDQTIVQHKATQETVVGWRALFDRQTAQLVGFATDDYPFLTCKYMECAMGNIIADSLFHSQPDGIDIAIINDGGIRAGIPKGNILTSDILTVLPFPNLIATFSMTGAEILASLEYITAGMTDTGLRIISLCHWSGLRYTYSASAPFKHKIIASSIRNPKTMLYGPIILDKVYKVAGNTFLTKGGDNIVTERECTTGRLMSEILQDYIELKSVVDPVLEGRITKMA